MNFLKLDDEEVGCIMKFLYSQAIYILNDIVHSSGIIE